MEAFDFQAVSVRAKKTTSIPLPGWTASGLSGAAFCTQQTLSYHRFVYERRKLRHTGGVSVTDLHAGNIELLGAVLRQL